MNKHICITGCTKGWGRSTSAEVAPYCATKWALEGLSQAMAQELPEGVAVAALNPGIIDTDMLRSCFGEGAGGYGEASDWTKRATGRSERGRFSGVWIRPAMVGS